MQVFTSAAVNYVPKARVLAESVKRHHPEATFHLVLCDPVPDWLAESPEPFDSRMLAIRLSQYWWTNLMPASAVTSVNCTPGAAVSGANTLAIRIADSGLIMSVQWNSLVVVDGLPLVVVLRTEQARLRGNLLRRLIRLEPPEELLRPGRLFVVPRAPVAQHQVVLRLYVLRIHRQDPFEGLHRPSEVPLEEQDPADQLLQRFDVLRGGPSFEFGGAVRAQHQAAGPPREHELNLIHHVARNSNDASAWYLGRDPSDQGNIVRHNFFHHVGRPDRKWTMGVYCDDATCGVLIEGNVFYKVASYGTVYSNGGQDITVRNNIFIEGYGPAYQLKSMWYDFGMQEIPYFFGEKGIYTERLLHAVDIRTAPYAQRYPGLKDWLDLMADGKTYVGMRPRRNVVDRNVLVKYEETFRLVAKYAQTDFGNNYITQDDPGFVDAGRMDFRLREDAAVYRELPGFEKIPFGEMGPRKPATSSP